MAATFEKANTYVFASLIIRDREVGGSNPLAPTINLQSINKLPSSAVNAPISSCGQFVDKSFLIYGINLF